MAGDLVRTLPLDATTDHFGLDRHINILHKRLALWKENIEASAILYIRGYSVRVCGTSLYIC